MGLSFGFLSVFRSLRYMARHPGAWPAALVPALVLLFLAVLLSGIAIVWVKPLVYDAIAAGAVSVGNSPTPPAAEPRVPTWIRYGATIASWVAAIASIALGFLLALIATPPLSSPALEALVTRRERDLGVPPREESRFWFELKCGLQAQAAGLLLFGPILLALWATKLLFPPVAPVTTPLELLVTAQLVAWNLLDYPLTLRHVGIRQRLRFLGRHIAPVVGFGAGFALLFWVPCFGVLLLPLGCLAATEVVWGLAAADPNSPIHLGNL